MSKWRRWTRSQSLDWKWVERRCHIGSWVNNHKDYAYHASVIGQEKDGAKRIFSPSQCHLRHMVSVKKSGINLPMKLWGKSFSCWPPSNEKVVWKSLLCVGNHVSFAINSLYRPEKLLIAPSLISKSYDLDYKLLNVQDSRTLVVPGTGFNTLLLLCYLIFTIIISFVNRWGLEAWNVYRVFPKSCIIN